ncbi:MAG: hypothetical protein JSW66_11775 [Phycisphaerales bacterium]|nr:MAG: hypothetical protein JSW66_11775 [Phycisphaerales bacterium]
MNALIRTTIAFAAVISVTADSLPGQVLPDESNREVLAARKEADLAQKQAEVARKQADVARRQALVAKAAVASSQPAPPVVPSPPVPPEPPAVTVSAPSIEFSRSWSSRSSGAGPVLVIPSADIKPEEIFAITEDMNVMSHIFEKNLDQARIATARGSFFTSRRDALGLLLGTGSGAIESMYLQGYGALFLLKVDFPLSGPPQVAEEEQAQEQEGSDPVWEEMRRQMYEPQESTRRKAKEPEAKYDAEKVENLKTTLVGTLKHAANIRSLKPDESVILTVTGSGESGATRLTAPTSRAISLFRGNPVIVQERDNDGTVKTRTVQSPSTGMAGSFAPTILVIRAKKSDIDEFAKGNLDLDQFRQRTQVLACPYLGGGIGRGDSLNAYIYKAHR